MNILKKAAHHLTGDIKGYEKEIRYLEKEIAEDKELLKELKRELHGRQKESCHCSRRKHPVGKGKGTRKTTRR
jgi:hypothetical protein